MVGSITYVHMLPNMALKPLAANVPEFVVSCVQGLGDGEILIRGYQYTGHSLSVSIRFCRSIQTAWRTDFTGNRREAVDISGDTLAFSAPHAKIMTFIIRL